MNRNKLAGIFIALSAAICGCEHPALTEPEKHDDASYSICSVVFSEDGADATRSSATIDIDQIRDICVFAFDAASGQILKYGSNAGIIAGDPVATYISGGVSRFEWILPTGIPMDIYAICNMGEISTPASTEALLQSDELVYRISSMADLNDSGTPMCGTLEDHTENGAGNNIVIPLKHMVAKYTLSIDSVFGNGVNSFSIDKVRVCNAHKHTRLFGKNEFAVGSSDILAEGDYATQSDLSALNSGKAVSFYMLENMQTTGNGVSTNLTKWNMVHDYLTANGTGSLCTYLEITGTKGYSNGGSGTDTYRIYLGRDCITDFDVRRNHIGNIALTLNLDNPTLTNSLTLRTYPTEIRAGESVTVYFGFDFMADPEMTDLITVTSSNSMFGISSLKITDDGNGKGEGSFILTCSSGVSNGETSVISVGTSQVSEKFKVTALKDVYSYSISLTPTSVAIGGSKQMNATGFTMRNGSTIASETITSQGIWTSSDESVVKVQNGLLTGISGGSATVSVSWNGTSASAKVTVPSPAVPVSLTVSGGPQGKVQLGEMFQISSVKCTMSDGSSKTLKTTDVTWKSSDNTIATVSSSGLISIVSPQPTASTSIVLSYTEGGVTVNGNIDIYVSTNYITGYRGWDTGYSFGLQVDYNDGSSGVKVPFTWYCTNGTIQSAGSGEGSENGYSYYRYTSSSQKQVRLTSKVRYPVMKQSGGTLTYDYITCYISIYAQ